jgi:myo-inositol 2-dehydrogenase/D-chiro-inositol 1-dehydrogenase
MADGIEALQLGFVGCGQVTANGHLRALQSLPAAKVVAVSDIDRNRLERVADGFGIERRYPDFLALLNDPAVEAVAVCVPAQSHVSIALAVLDAGKHLFIEKPLALSLDDSDRLIERANHSTAKIMVGFNLRWHRQTCQARSIIQKGTLGPVQVIRSILTSGTRFEENCPEWRKRRELGGGELFETAVHHFDLWCFLLQTEIEEVFAISRSGEWDDETAAITAQLANGVLASAVFSTRTGNSNDVDIHGQTGRLALSLVRFDGLEFLPGSNLPGDMQSRWGGIVRALTDLPRAALGARQGGDFIASYRAEWQYFIDCIRGGLPVDCSLADGRRALQVILAAMESASLGKPVKVADAARKVTAVHRRTLQS